MDDKPLGDERMMQMGTCEARIWPRAAAGAFTGATQVVRTMNGQVTSP